MTTILMMVIMTPTLEAMTIAPWLYETGGRGVGRDTGPTAGTLLLQTTVVTTVITPIVATMAGGLMAEAGADATTGGTGMRAAHGCGCGTSRNGC